SLMALGMVAFSASVGTHTRSAQAKGSGVTIPVVQGWFARKSLHYYDFGPAPAATADIYAFITGFDGNGNPIFVKGQHNVVDSVPGKPVYSPLWQVVFVTVPKNYMPDKDRDYKCLIKDHFTFTPTKILVNCPIIEE